MKLPFNTTKLNTSKLNPVYSRAFEVYFGYETLDECCYKVTDKYFHFTLNKSDNKIVPLETLDKLIEKQKILNVKVILFDRTGEVVSTTYIENVELLEIKDFLNFDYNSDDIIKIRVKYNHTKWKTWYTEKELKTYERKLKLQKINNTI